MRPLTDQIPKPLLPVGGVPLIERHIVNLAAAGITEIVVNTSYLADQLSTFLEVESMGWISPYRMRRLPSKPLAVLFRRCRFWRSAIFGGEWRYLYRLPL